MRKRLALLCLAACSWLTLASEDGTGGAGASVGGPVSPAGEICQIPLPVELHMRNTGGSDGPRGPGSGSGLCVFTSIEHSGRWQNIPYLDGLQQWMTRRPGGGYPRKVDAMLREFFAEKGTEPPKYIQVESNDLDILELACRTGRMPGVTYAYSPTGRYGGGYIAHMVSLAHAKGDTWAIIDNNFPGNWEWMSRAQFLRAYKGRDQGWSVIFLDPGPPPAPILPPPTPK